MEFMGNLKLLLNDREKKNNCIRSRKKRVVGILDKATRKNTLEDESILSCLAAGLAQGQPVVSSEVIGVNQSAL